MIYTGIGDEAGASLGSQIAAVNELGWTHLEMRAVSVNGGKKENFHDITDSDFDHALRELDRSNVRVNCFGSTIMNWARRVDDPFELTLEEVKRAIPRMQRTETKFVRIMSFKPADGDFRIPGEVFRRVREVTNRFLDAGLQPVHENCMNYGGMSWQHALELLDKCPGLKWAFDTANPIFNSDRSKAKPWPWQDPWEFWEHIRDHTVHIHVKDAVREPGSADPEYTWPGEGQGAVRQIIKDALSRGYSGALSIEPHMVTVFHQPDKVADETKSRKNFVDYGKVLQEIVKAES
jgi:sugar phosphate isomerase/epimerase